MKKYFYLFTIIAFISAVSGCNPYNNTGEGAATGGALGALAGGIIGHQSHNTGTGALIGGGLGAVTGAVVGSQIQKPVYEQPAPAVVAQPVPAVTYSGNIVTVNIPNSNGSYTAVVLRRSGYGFIGPQGEYYPQLPTVDQLRVMYGK